MVPRDDVGYEGPPLRPGGRLVGLEGLSAADCFVLSSAGLFTIARVPTYFPWTLRLALLAVVGMPGAAILARLVLRRDTSACILVLFLLTALVSALLSPEPFNSTIGDLASYLSVLVLFLCAGWWAAGTALSWRARDLLPWVLVTGVALNGLVAALQIAHDVRDGPLGTVQGRASGLMDNPVYYGSLCAGLASWGVFRAARMRSWRWAALVLLLAFASGLSGSRVALAVVLTVALIMVVLERSAAAVIAMAAAVVGFGGASGFAAALGSGASLTGRVAATSGSGGRWSIWQYGLQAFAERPIVGWGPDQYGPATWHRYTSEFVRGTRWNDNHQLWVDPHNILVLLLATVGVVGTGIAAAFALTVVVRRCRVDLLVIALATATTWLLQPARNTLPLVMLTFGAAMSAASARHAGRSDHVEAPSRSWTRPQIACLLVGLALGCYVLVGDLRFGRALAANNDAAISDAAEWFPRDPIVASHAASELYRASVDGRARGLDSAVRWARRAADRDAHSAQAWTRLASFQMYANDLGSASRSLDMALRQQEWNPSARAAMLRLAQRLGDEGAIASAMAVACDLRLAVCVEENGIVPATTP